MPIQAPPPPSSAPLTPERLIQARRRLLRYSSLNGVAVTFMMENILLLWALQNGLTATRVAVMSSFIFLTMPFMLLGKSLSRRIGMAKAWSICWFSRYFFVLAMVPAPWLRHAGHDALVAPLILVSTFALFSLRSMGMVNTVPLLSALSPPGELGSFQAKNHFRFYSAYFLTLIAVNLILGWRDSAQVYQAFLVTGAAVGMISALILFRVPDPPDQDGGANRPMRESLRILRENHCLRRLSWTWCGAACLMALTAPISVLAVKNGYGVSDQAALILIIVEVSGGVFSSMIVGAATDHTGPRPLLLLGLAMFLGAALFWALAPSGIWWPALLLVFLVLGIAKGFLLLTLSHYLLVNTRNAERMDIGMWMQMLSGAVSGLAGVFIAGGLLQVLTPFLGDGMELYRGYFRIVALMAAGITFAAAAGLPPLKEWAIRDVIGLLFSLNDFRTLVTLNRMRATTSDVESLDRLQQLSALGSRHSEPVLRGFLEEGRMMTQARAIEVLGRIPFGPETAEALIRLVETGVYTNGWRAAELLGRRRIRAAVPCLRKGLDSEDPFLAGKCLEALARLEDTDSYPAIRRIFRESENPRLVVHGAMALQTICQRVDLTLLLEKAVSRPWPGFLEEELSLAVAALLHQHRKLFQALKHRTENGVPPPPSPDALAAWPELQDFLTRHPWDTLPPSLRLALALAA